MPHMLKPHKPMLKFLLLFIFPIAIHATPTPITLEHAVTPQESAWGLMGRTSIPDHYGMLFAYPQPRYISLWSFNCFTDLDIAFLDENGTILEITKLKAYPEKMDPKRPVKSLMDLLKYPPEDPIIQFFSKHSITSKALSKFALETRLNFFTDNNIKVGDSLTWQKSSGVVQSHHH